MADGRWQGEVWNRKKDGSLYPEWLSISTLKDNHGKVQYYLGVFSDITPKKEAEELIRHYAYHDPLTSLPNRRFFDEKLQDAINIAKRQSKFIGLVSIDLDYFKEVNYRLGHDAGDEYLKAVGNLIRDSLRDIDVLARIGGDEFLVLLPEITSVVDCKVAINRLTNSILGAKLNINGQEFKVSASIGAAIYPDDAAEIEQLIQFADKAMYYVKHNGKTAVCFWQDL